MTDEQILDIIDTAGYGIAYWCHRADIDENARTYTIHSEELPLPVELSFDRIAELAGNYNYAIEDIDAAIADVIIQRAVFGAVVLG